MRPRVLPAALVLGAFLLGCAGGTPATPSPVTTPLPTVAPTASPSPPATASPEAPSPAGGGAACAPPVVCAGNLAPGEYETNALGPTIRFTVGDGWQSAEVIPDVGLELTRPDSGGPAAMSIVAFDGDVFAQTCDPDAGTTTIDTTPQAFINWLVAREGIEAEGVEEVEVGGQPALQVDLTTSVPDRCQDPPWIWLWTLPVVGDFHFNDDETARVIAVDAPRGPVVIVIEAFPGADFEGFLEHASTVVDSMAISE